MKVAYPVTDATAPPVSLVPNPALQTCLPSSMSVPMSMPMTMPMTVPTTMPMTMPTSMPMTMPMMNMNYSMPYMVLQQPQVPMMNMNQMGFSYPFVQTVAPANPMSAPATYPTLYPGSTEEPSQPERH
ncbi:hypothetical protein AGDE_12987 [Angomonas deanei]|uniref:Uncharacterized protein n=1 Tax=Angomonas deanei TaxID=59799 RepID=A0A7G2CCQ9_9TRYP|nr:hypothetical protein AGDE_12987 [Angomonas deanei]CAD2216503.1 hypothetical protein, conserved [Angomonas deanei]|eukprot:EPY23121.1 hypothetical protein AGDE_12987 [Angomonas deanei]